MKQCRFRLVWFLIFWKMIFCWQLTIPFSELIFWLDRILARIFRKILWLNHFFLFEQFLMYFRCVAKFARPIKVIQSIICRVCPKIIDTKKNLFFRNYSRRFIWTQTLSFRIRHIQKNSANILKVKLCLPFFD